MPYSKVLNIEIEMALSVATIWTRPPTKICKILLGIVNLSDNAQDTVIPLDYGLEPKYDQRQKWY